MMRYAIAVLFFIAASFPAEGQIPGEGTVYVSVSDLVTSPGRYNDRPVRVVGDLVNSDFTDSQNRIYALQGETGLERVRVGMSVNSLQDLPFLVGQRVEIQGIFWDLSIFGSTVGIRNFPGARREGDGLLGESWLFIGVSEVVAVEEEPAAPAEEDDEPREFVRPDLPDSNTVDLRELMSNPEPYYDKLISVIGKFRGDNVYGDLPMDTKKTPRDFIIKVADTAIWVTGKRPRGDGFELNPERRRDTGKWLEVTGTPWTDDGQIYLRARLIEMVDKPEDPDLEPRTMEEEVAELEKDEAPPEVIFTVPLNGERGIPLGSEFRIQFSKDMKSASFDRNIDLLYADDVGDGNPFPDMQVSYDTHSRSLAVIPGKRLEPGREIRLILYEGIRDDGDRPLVADPEADVRGAVVILSFFTAGLD